MIGMLPESAQAQPGWRIARQAAQALHVAGITADSRKVAPGFLFAALPGQHVDGRRFIADAVARGAAVVLAPLGTEWPPGVPPRLLIEDAEPRQRLAQLAALRAGPQPAAIAAITGTNGKTSVADFIRQLCAADGAPAASLGTLGTILAGTPAMAPELPPSPVLTTPDPVQLAETLAALARAGVQRVAIEASSHGLDQFRLDGVRLVAAGFTNFTRDHLDYHGDLNAYRRAKLRLFAQLLPEGGVAVADSALDPQTLVALREIATARHLSLRLVGDAGDAIRLLHATPRPDGQTLRLALGGRSREIMLKLSGRFQADNALLAAVLAATLCGQSLDWALERLPRLAGVRGRMECAARLENGAAVYVDYAHTPDALETLLRALRPHSTGRLVLVFGAGGDRDRGKRPLMGAIAARLADFAIITDDNPRSEPPAAIRAAIRSACPGALEIGDRRAAIAAGLAALRPGDVLAVAGKGHEQGQTIGGTVLPFDDAETIRALLGGA